MLVLRTETSRLTKWSSAPPHPLLAKYILISFVVCWDAARGAVMRALHLDKLNIDWVPRLDDRYLT